MERTIRFVSTPTPDIPADVWEEAELYAALGIEEGTIENDGELYQWEIRKEEEAHDRKWGLQQDRPSEVPEE